MNHWVAIFCVDMTSGFHGFAQLWLSEITKLDLFGVGRVLGVQVHVIFHHNANGFYSWILLEIIVFMITLFIEAT